MICPDPISACLRGEISPEVAIARLVLNGETAAAIQRRLQGATDRNGYWTILDRLTTPAIINRLRRMIDTAQVHHDGTATPARIAAQFDRAMAASPEASVAMYSLGDPAILGAATTEIISWLNQNRLINPSYAVLDLGCGIGRVAAALAGQVRFVHGVDVSPAMVREAKHRCAALPNATFALTAGTDLAAYADAMFDLILAVDTFPYLVQAGLADKHVAESRRVLRPSGSLVVMNLSYRGDPGLDNLDAEIWARSHGFTIQHHDPRPFRLWDASCWIFTGQETVSAAATFTRNPP